MTEAGEALHAQISIRLMSGEEVLATTAQPLDTVRSLKRKIEAVTNIAISQQCLIFGTTMLSNRWTIEQAKLSDGGLVQFVQTNLEGKSADIFVPVHTLPNGCTVLERHVEPNYKPPEDVVDEYAEHLGIDPDTEADYLWIAQECLMAPVPAPWMSCCVAEGDIFYFNSDTGLTTWEHPCEEMYRKVFQNLREVRAQAAVQKGTGKDTEAFSVPLGALPRQYEWDDSVSLSDDDDATSVASFPGPGGDMAGEEGEEQPAVAAVPPPPSGAQEGQVLAAAAATAGDNAHLALIESKLPRDSLPGSLHERYRFLRKRAIEERASGRPLSVA